MFYPPLRNEFTKFGDKFVKIAHNEANGMYCYKRTTSEGLILLRGVQSSPSKGRGRQHIRTLSEILGIRLRHGPLHPRQREMRRRQNRLLYGEWI